MPLSIPRRELIRKFRALGYDGPYSGGKHQFMIQGQKKVRVPTPHGSKIVHVNLVLEILKQAGISPEEWDAA